MQNKDIERSFEEFFSGFNEWKTEPINYPGLMHDIIKGCFYSRKVEELHEVCFSARAVTGLIGALKRASTSAPGFNNTALGNDFKIQLQLTNEKLSKLIPDLSGEVISESSKHTIEDLIGDDASFPLLVNDLSELKKYFNILMQADSAGRSVI